MRLIRYMSLGLLVASLCACQGPETRVSTERSALELPTPEAIADESFRTGEPQTPEDIAPPALVLGPGDVLEIEVYGMGKSRETCSVGVDGMIYYGPLIGISAKGLTISALQHALTNELTKWYQNPRVVLTVLEFRSQRATILGRVGTPGSIALQGGERVIDLISEAGGLATSRFSGSTEELADLSGAIYIRNETVLPVDFNALVKEGDLSHNIRVHPGDHCYIPSSLSREITMLGGVNSPKTVGFKKNLTLVQAIAKAGGFSPYAHQDRVLVLRGTATQPRAARIDVNEIIAGNSPDLLLEPRDVIWVPQAGAMHPKRVLQSGAQSFVAAAFATTGADLWDDTAPTIIPAE